MPFEEKLTWVNLVVTLGVAATYFTAVLTPLGEVAAAEIAYQRPLLIAVGARFHLSGLTHANILFFHGNGEIAADYDAIGPFYNRIGVNFLAVDYRGYGRSTGSPTVSAMMRDCHAVFKYACGRIDDVPQSGPLIVMGRSLGSAPAIELAFTYPDRVRGLVVESGFARVIPLLRLLGIDATRYGVEMEFDAAIRRQWCLSLVAGVLLIVSFVWSVSLLFRQPEE